MKTLAEVIKACEETVSDVDRGVDIEGCYLGATETRDALHYLKEYREMLNTRIYIPEGYTREKTGFTHQDFANTFREEPHFIRDFMVGTSQNLENTSQKITCPKCHSEFVILPESNPALTWEQLKQMEGKPVWVEYISCKRKVWAIVDCFYTDAFGKVKMNVALPHDYWNLERELIGTKWQAYRKERNEES